MSNKPLIVSFEQADSAQIDKLGAKGAKLADDFQHALELFPGLQEVISVPDGFILSTDVWRAYREAGNRLTDELFEQINVELANLGTRLGRHFGDLSGRMPLIVAVRGGAPISLPGAISTILNVGLNDEVVAALINAGEDESFVLTTYLTAIRMFGEVVLGIQYDHFY
jgi:pyruvate, orthophosphate dikinase